MKIQAFKIVAGIAGGYHVLLGALGILCPKDTVASVAARAYGLALEIDPQMLMVVKFTSVYMLAFGVMLLILASNPAKYRAFAVPAIVLFGIRLLNRIFLFNTLTLVGIPPARNAVGTAIIAFFFVSILVLLPKTESMETSDAVAEDS